MYTLWSKSGYFGLLENTLIFWFIILLWKNESVVSNTVTIAQGVRYFGRSCMYGVE